MQLFGLEDAGLLDNMPVEGDTVTAAAALAADPYLLLGCASGAVRVAALLGADGQLAEVASPLASVELKPYTGERHLFPTFNPLSVQQVEVMSVREQVQVLNSNGVDLRLQAGGANCLSFFGLAAEAAGQREVANRAQVTCETNHLLLASM